MEISKNKNNFNRDDALRISKVWGLVLNKEDPSENPRFEEVDGQVEARDSQRTGRRGRLYLPRQCKEKNI